MTKDLVSKQICGHMKSERTINLTSTYGLNQVPSNSSDASNSNMVSNPKIIRLKSKSGSNHVSSNSSDAANSNIVSNPKIIRLKSKSVSNHVSSNSSDAANSNIVCNPKSNHLKSKSPKDASTAFCSPSNSNVGTNLDIVTNHDEAIRPSNVIYLSTNTAKEISITEAVFDVCNQLVDTVTNASNIMWKHRASRKKTRVSHNRHSKIDDHAKKFIPESNDDARETTTVVKTSSRNSYWTRQDLHSQAQNVRNVHQFRTAGYSSEMPSLENQTECIFVDGATLDEAEYRIPRENIEVLMDWSKPIANIDSGSKYPEKERAKEGSSLKILVSENVSEIPSLSNEKKCVSSKNFCAEKDGGIVNSLNSINDDLNVKGGDQSNSSLKSLNKGGCLRSGKRKRSSRNRVRRKHHGHSGSSQADQISSSEEIHSTLDGEKMSKLSITTDLHVEIIQSKNPVVDLSRDKDRIQKYLIKLSNTSHGDESNSEIPNLTGRNGKSFAAEVIFEERTQTSNFDLTDDQTNSEIPNLTGRNGKPFVAEVISEERTQTSNFDLTDDQSNLEIPNLTGQNGKPFVTEVISEERTQASNFDLCNDLPMPILAERHLILGRFKKRRKCKSNVASEQKIQKLETREVNDIHSDSFSNAKEPSKILLAEAAHQQDGIDKIQSYANEGTEATSALITDGANEQDSNAQNEVLQAFSENNTMETIGGKRNKPEMHKTEVIKNINESSFEKNESKNTNALTGPQEITTPKRISSQFFRNLSISKYKRGATPQNRKIKMYSKLKKLRMRREGKETGAKTHCEPSSKLDNSCSVRQSSVKGKNTNKSIRKFPKNSTSLKGESKSVELISQSTQTNEQNSLSLENSQDSFFILSGNPFPVKNSNTTSPGLKSCTVCEKRKSVIKRFFNNNRMVDCPKCEINKLCSMIISRMEKVDECRKQKPNNLDDKTWQLLKTAIDLSKYLAYFCQLCTISLSDLQFVEGFNNSKLPTISSDNSISIPSNNNVNSVPSVDNIKLASDIHNAKSLTNTDYVNSASSTNNVKFDPIKENVKSQLSSHNVNSHQSADSVKPPQSTDTVKPPQITNPVKPPQSTDTVKPSMSSENLKPSLNSERLKPSLISESLKPPMNKDKVKAVRNSDRETRNEENEVLDSMKNGKHEKPLVVTEIIDSDEDCVVIEVRHSSPSTNSKRQKKNTFQDYYVAGVSNQLHNVRFPFRNPNSLHNQRSNNLRWMSTQLLNGRFIRNPNMISSQVPSEPRHFNVTRGISSGGRMFTEQPLGSLRNEDNPAENMLRSRMNINPVHNSNNSSNSMLNVNQEYMDQWSLLPQQSYRDLEQSSQSNRDFNIGFVKRQASPSWNVNESFPNNTNIDSSGKPARYNERSNNFVPATVNVNNYYGLTEGNIQPFRKKVKPPSQDPFMDDNTYNQMMLNMSDGPNRGIKLQTNFPSFIAARQNSMTGDIGSSMINSNNSGTSTAGMIPPPQEITNLLPMNVNPSHKRMPMSGNVPNRGTFFEEGSLNYGSRYRPARHNSVSTNIDMTVLNPDCSRVSIEARTPQSVEHSAYSWLVNDKGKLGKGITPIRRASSRKNSVPIRRKAGNDQKSEISKNTSLKNPGISEKAIQNPACSNTAVTQNSGTSHNPKNPNPPSTIGVPLPTLDNMVPNVTVAGNSKPRETGCNSSSL